LPKLFTAHHKTLNSGPKKLYILRAKNILSFLFCATEKAVGTLFELRSQGASFSAYGPLTQKCLSLGTICHTLSGFGIFSQSLANSPGLFKL